MHTKIYNSDGLVKDDIDEVIIRVKIFLINSKDQILIARSGGGVQLIGGHLEHGENISDCIRREIAEETGVILPKGQEYSPYFIIKHWTKNYNNTELNRESQIQYFYIKLNALVDLSNLLLTENEKANAFSLEYIPKSKFFNIISHCERTNPTPINRVIATEIISAYTELIIHLENLEYSPLARLIRNNPILAEKRRGLPDVGKNPINNSSFSDEVESLYNSYKFFGNEILDIADSNLTKFSFWGGSPLRFKPFPISIKYINDSLHYFDYSQYTLAAGDDYYKNIILEYLLDEGFKRDTDDITANNIIPTTSTTQAFNLLVQTIAKPNDVIITTSPSYGIFGFIPERYGVTMRFLELKEEDNYFINVDILDLFIRQITKELDDKYAFLPQDNRPRVIAFINTNPHNPLGTVINNENVHILKNVCEVCKKHKMFLIDDIIYRDICFSTNKAIPAMSFGEYFDNIITIFGLSKSFGLAGLRAGLIIANEKIISGVRNIIFQMMDSLPLINLAALAGAFNNSVERNECYNKYFSSLNSLYKKKYALVKREVATIDGIKILNAENVQAGFFYIVDFSSLKGKVGREIVINNDLDLLKYFFKYGRIKFIVGSSMGVFDDTKIYGRFTFAIPDKDIVDSWKVLKRLISGLK
jgi:aspartate/methionine/tyrosine aminotransferase/ADP-ribose pyrophosphatase YjhB (NUDIX family)